MAKTIVTGGAGLIGSHLCERLLNDGHSVLCVDNLLTGDKKNVEHLEAHENFSFIDFDVIKGLPESMSFDALFHLASPASPNHHSEISYHALPMETMLVNTTGTLELLKRVKEQNARFLFASTSEAYGDPDQHPQKETYNGNVSSTGPRSVYDEAKRFGETLTAYFYRDQGVDTRIARIFNTYGPNMRKDDKRMIIDFINQALKNEPITVFGDGSQTRSLCYVTDTVDGLVKLLFTDRAKGEIVNIGSTQEHTVMEYAELVKKITGSESEIVTSEALPKDDPLKRRPDITKAKELLDWEPKVPLEEGLMKTVQYLKSQNIT
ncbi:MAG TPA: SDR family oxidoreductase [Candidatus Levybacteria bacterium]|nr:SDR family oxidoreductase [Candidatus Levybacteria bacterium]